MKKKFLCLVCALSLCAGIGYCVSKPILRRVYSNLPDNIKTQDYYVIDRDDETGVDYFKFYDKSGKLVTVVTRIDANGNPFVTSDRTTP